MAESDSILIEQVEAELTLQEKEKRKSWSLEILHFGEMIKKDAFIYADHHFYSPSPVNFLPKDTPHRAVYFCRPQGYGSGFVKRYQKLQTDLQELRRQWLEKRAGGGLLNEAQDRSEFGKKIWLLSEAAAPELFDQVQIEPGKYELKLAYTYRSTRNRLKWMNRTRKVETSLKFEIETNVRSVLKPLLHTALFHQSANVVYGETFVVSLPEYNPVNVEEVLAF